MAPAAWLLRLGFFADLPSRPVLFGYMAGAALIMIGAICPASGPSAASPTPPPAWWPPASAMGP